jgi:glycosyltransferase involved in cell wall biosynthesis
MDIMSARHHKYDVLILGANTHQVGRYQNGGGYRNYELALTLRDCGVRAAVVSPGPTDFENSPVPVLDQSRMSYDEICSSANAFIFYLLEDLTLVELLKTNGKVLIYDSYLSPVEQLTYEEVLILGDEEKIQAHFHQTVDKHNRFNELADYFIVGQPEEKLLKLGELINTHRVSGADYRTLGHRIFPVPVIGYSKHNLPAGNLAPTGNAMLWNGGLWNHYSGTDLIIDTVRSLRCDGHDISFCFLYPRKTTIAHALVSNRIEEENLQFIQLGLPGGRPPDFFEKQEILAGCRAFVLLYESVLQMHLVLSMRLREVLLFEKPIIASKHGVLGAFVEQNGIGLTVDNTLADLRSAMLRLMTDAALYSKLVENIRLLKGRYDLENFVPPLAAAITAANRHRAP